MVAKGFGKNYFRLTAITATASSVTLHKIATKILHCRYHINRYESSDDPPDEELDSLLHFDKPCYCNIFFACLAHKVLRLSRIKKPPLCRCRYTKTGIAPPVHLSF